MLEQLSNYLLIRIIKLNFNQKKICSIANNNYYNCTKFEFRAIIIR